MKFTAMVLAAVLSVSGAQAAIVTIDGVGAERLTGPDFGPSVAAIKEDGFIYTMGLETVEGVPIYTHEFYPIFYPLGSWGIYREGQAAFDVLSIDIEFRSHRKFNTEMGSLSLQSGDGTKAIYFDRTFERTTIDTSAIFKDVEALYIYFSIPYSWNDYFTQDSSERCTFTYCSELFIRSITIDAPPVPLPAGGVLLLTGLGAMAVVRRRSTSAATHTNS